MPIPETDEHRAIKEKLCEQLNSWIGVGITEYPSSGHELDTFGATEDGISIYIETIWSDSKQQFLSDINIIHQSDADVKLVVASPYVMAKDEYRREYSKVVIAQRLAGKIIHGQMLNGLKILDDSDYLTITLKDIVLGLINQARLRRGPGATVVTGGWRTKLQPSARINISQLAYYSLDKSAREPFIQWSIKNQGDIYKWLQIPYIPLIPLPLPFIPFRHQTDLYTNYVSWFGKREILFDILMGLESMIQETYGVGFEIWTVPSNEPYTLTEDHSYITGCGAEHLRDCLMVMCTNGRSINFGWFLSSKSIAYTIAGGIHNDVCDININSMISFIPNKFPFVSIDETGRVDIEYLSVNKATIKNNLKEWKSSVKDEFWVEDLSNRQLEIFPSARVVGYLGGKPRPRAYDSPFRAEGLTIIEMNLNNMLQDVPPLVTNISPLICHISSAPSGLNDLKEVKAIGIKCNAIPFSQYPARDLTLVLFSVECYVNQSKSYRLLERK